MKHIKTFTQLNEGLDTNSQKKEFDKQIKLIEDISKAILDAKDFKETLKSMQKENPEVAKNFKGYFDLALKASKIVKKIKVKGLSSKNREAVKQLKAISDFADSLKEGFKNIKTLKNKTQVKNNEGLGNVVGNTLRNILTGQWIINILKGVKSNLMDSSNELNTLQDYFDINDY